MSNQELLLKYIKNEPWFFRYVHEFDDAYGQTFRVMCSFEPKKEDILRLFGEEPAFFCGKRVIFHVFDFKKNLVRIIHRTPQRQRGTAWKELYDRFEEISGVNMLEQGRKNNLSGLKYAEKHGYITDLYMLAESMWGKKS